ncbi:MULTISPECIES: S8 family serine peptidase [unclassified Marinovum]
MSESVEKSFTRRKASDTVRVAITLPGKEIAQGPVAFSGAISTTTLAQMRPDQNHVEDTKAKLARMGFEITGTGEFSINARCTRKQYEEIFGTQLERKKLPFSEGEKRQANAFYFPGDGADWNPREDLSSMIDDAYIQWPHIYMNSRFPGPTSALPPDVSYHHLRVPGDVTMLLNADTAHRGGITGKGVRVAMIDSGFAQSHAYFKERGYLTKSVLAPGATDVEMDGNGHGTAESANLLAMAPDVEFTGIKLDNENFPAEGATILEGLQTAMLHNPQVISISLGFDLTQPGSRNHLDRLPNSLRAMEAEIKAITQGGTIVVFSAGNGHVAFPGMMPEVISAGGVYVAQNGAMQASDYASAFTSRIYPGRHVPDASGLVGMAANGANYIMLPVQPECETDRQNADGTGRADGWAVISGTSAAAPQLAGAIALLLQKNPGLSAEDIKQVFNKTSRDVVDGHASPASNQSDGGVPASAGKDGATGAGLIDISAALAEV